MYFYVDESGQTGLNLFDENQPELFYGVLSSKVDLDESIKTHVESMREILGVERLHAAELGGGGLAKIGSKLLTIQRKNEINFDLYRIKKTDHALICFFDQVFDQGLNKAVPWTAYWTPLRYVLLFKVSALFDLELLKKAWDARITTNDALANEKFIRVCGVLLSRVGTLPDARSREIISDSLRWAMKYPEEIHYNVYKKKDSLDISPNLIGFQSVLHGITSRLKLEGESAVKIIVDRQSQFNKAQESIASYYRKARGQELPLGVGLPVMDLKDFPNVPISCTAGTDSVGLEIVDIYLWAFKRFFEKKSLPPDLRRLILNKVDNVYTDSVSLEAIYNRWGEVMLNLPEPTDEQKELVKEILEKQENARRPHVQSL